MSNGLNGLNRFNGSHGSNDMKIKIERQNQKEKEPEKPKIIQIKKEHIESDMNNNSNVNEVQINGNEFDICINHGSKRELIKVSPDMKIIDLLNAINDKFDVEPKFQELTKSWPHQIMDTKYGYMPISRFVKYM